MDNLSMKSQLTMEQIQVLNSEMDNKKKSKGIAYVWWFFTGGIGGHRFYAGDTGYALGMLFTLGGLGFWTLVDVFLIGKRIEAKNQEKEKDIIRDLKAFER